jgi:ABC-type phosphate/phosphonate transport system substrate-binding protein
MPQQTPKRIIFKHSMLVGLVCCLSFGFISLALSESQTSEAPYYTLGVFPYLPPARIESLYAPVAANLSAVSDKPIKLKSRPDFDAFRQEVMHARYDIIFIQPFDYVRIPKNLGYIPIVRWQGMLQAVFVSQPDVDVQINGIQYLRGKNIAMPDKNAAVSLLGKIALTQAGISIDNDVNIHYNKNHFECLKQVVLKKSSICVTAIPPLTLFESRTKNKLKIIVKSQKIPTPLFAVHKRVPKSVLKRIQHSMENWHLTEEGKQILKSIKFHAFIRTDDKVYDPVREMWKNFSASHQQIQP